ncbi:MAG: hypothetical protein ACYDCL_11825 [Myxococcales bacterium]
MSGGLHLIDERAQDLASGAPAAAEEAAHLEACEPCRELAQSYRELSRALSTLPAPPAPGLTPAVLARIEARGVLREQLALGGLLLLLGLWTSGLLLRLALPVPSEGAAFLAAASALARVALSLGPALPALQALAALACAAVGVPAVFVLYRLLPPAAGRSA